MAVTSTFKVTCDCCDKVISSSDPGVVDISDQSINISSSAGNAQLCSLVCAGNYLTTLASE